ncbi:MAG: transposase [Anaerolineae bacterium]|nr:transposase [Anaerolineae bacterium]
MPYEYRHMTPEERAAAVEERRQRGYPLHSPPHPYREAGWYCITAANYEHTHIMASPNRLTVFEDQLLSELGDIQAEIGGWVILTNHYHFLVGVQSLEQISAVLRHLHGTTARVWNLEDGLTGQRKVWYRFRDRYIRNEHHYYHALNYLHYNAVKHGYVESPYDWPWASVNLYLDTHGQQWLRERWVKYPIGDVWDYGDEG